MDAQIDTLGGVNHPVVKLTAHKQHVTEGHEPKKGQEPPLKWIVAHQRHPAQTATAWTGIDRLVCSTEVQLTINSEAESCQESPLGGLTLTYSHSQVEDGDVVLLWSHGHGGLKDGAQGQQEGDGEVSECDVLFRKISCPEGREGITLDV